MRAAERRLADTARRLAHGRRLLVLLDFDGTLAEFKADPDDVYLSESRRGILRQLQRRAVVGVISGRRLEDVRARCGVDGLIVAGLHGVEIEAFGERFVHPEVDAAGVAIAAVRSALRQATADLPGVFVEDKGASVALHFREADAVGQRNAVETFEAAAKPHVDAGRLRVMRGSCVLELLPNVDWNKGHATRWIADHFRQHEGDGFVIYIGDDVTDQDAFRAVESDGMPIAASDRVSAPYTLDGPVAVERFLAAL
jgi:alpha,alpha-trehalase